jgi:hypothetical protein
MAKRHKAPRALQKYIDKTVRIGLGMAVLSLASLVASTFIDGRAFGIALATASSAIFTIAIVNFIYGPYQEDDLAQEVLRHLGVRDSLAAARLKQTEATEKLNLEELIGVSTTVVALPLDPDRWARDAFLRILELATRRPIKLEVFLPEPERPYIDALAHRSRQSDTDVRELLRTLPDTLARTWDERDRHDESELRVIRYAGWPSVGILRCDACVVLEIGAVVRWGSLDRRSQSFVYAPEAPIGVWVTEQLLFRADQLPPTVAQVRSAAKPAGLSTRADRDEFEAGIGSNPQTGGGGAY